MKTLSSCVECCQQRDGPPRCVHSLHIIPAPYKCDFTRKDPRNWRMTIAELSIKGAPLVCMIGGAGGRGGGGKEREIRMGGKPFEHCIISKWNRIQCIGARGVSRGGARWWRGERGCVRFRWLDAGRVWRGAEQGSLESQLQPHSCLLTFMLVTSFFPM